MLKGVLWIVGGVLSGVPRTNLTSSKAVGAVGPSVEPRGGAAVWG